MAMSNGQAAGCAVGGGGKEQLSAIGRMILESQTLDGDGEELSAFQSYLKTVQYITQFMAADLMTNQGRGSLPKEKAVKLFKMAKNCLERSEEMYLYAQEEGRGLASSDTVMDVAQLQQSTTIPIPTSTTTNLTLPTPTASTGQARSVPSAISTSPTTTADRPFHSVGTSYMREARLKNQYMMDQYRAHLRSQMKPHSQEMGLSMLRRLEENRSVAKIRQQNLARKARERQLRLQQTYAKGVSKKTQVVRLSQLSVDELREHVTSFEHGKHPPILTALKNKLSEGQERLENFKSRLASHPPHTPSSPTPSTSSTATEVYNFVNEILSNPDHPLSRLLGEYQMEVFTLLKPLQLAREKAGDTPTLCVTPKGQTNCQPEDTVKSRCVSSPPQPPLQAPANYLTSSHPPTLTSSHPPIHMSSHPPTITSSHAPLRTPSHPPTITVQGSSLDQESSQLDLFYMNDESENEDDLFMLSNTNFSPPGDRNFNRTPSPQQEGDDMLSKLRAELEGSLCEDGGRCVTQVHTVMGGKEEGGGGAYDDEGRCVNPLNTVGEGEGSECGDGGRFVTLVHRELGGEGGCEDGGRCVTQLHMPTEDEEDSKDTPTRDNTTTPTRYNEVYMDPDCLEETQQNLLLPPHDLTDGAMFSRPHPPTEEEEEEEIVFPGLVPLSCRCYYSNDEEMKSLKATSESILAQAVAMIHTFLDKLEQLFTSCYPTLSSPTLRGECQSVLESLFFPALLPSLLAAYRCKHYAEEVATARNMCRHVNATPKDLDVRRKFWLLDEPTAPYNEAIIELCRVRDLHYPSGKLTCLVSTSRLIVKCIDDYYEPQGQPKGSMDSGVGVDDILPIMSYIIVRSRLPQLVSEAAIMEEFIQDEYVKGEEGFCLTSFMTALKFVSRMSS